MRFKGNKPISSAGNNGNVQQKRRYAMVMPPGPPPEPPSADPADFVAFAAAWQALAEPTHINMGQDDNHRREMVELTGTLARRDACTYVAVQSGNWTTADTWLNISTELFEVPTAGAIIGIPSGITVTMNNNTTTEYNRLRIDGTLQFAINQNTRLEIDTIVVNHGGTFQQGTVANPIPAAYTSIVEYPSTADLNPAVDIFLIGRGLISMGNTYIHGQLKDHWITTSQARSPGDATILLDAVPTGWENGDEIHIMSTRRSGWVEGGSFTPHRADNVTITNITGSTITFTPALTHAHAVQADPTSGSGNYFADLKYYVVNFTRNVKHRSPVDTAVHRRAHMMVMHEDVDIRWSSWDWMGRTPKATTNVDATNDAEREAVRGVGVNWAADSPVRGRYNLHVHRAGIATGQPFAEIVGCTATKAPGWTMAHHQSYANFRKNAVRQFVGAGYMAEIGSEVGVWEDNFAGQAEGYISGGSPVEKGLSRVPPFPGTPVTRFAQDHGKFGSGMWFRSRGIQVRRNVLAGCGGGLVWMSRGGVQPDSNVNPTDLNIDGRAFYGTATGQGVLSLDVPPLTIFRDNVIVDAQSPWLIIKNIPNQGHEIRTFIKDNLAWEIGDGANMEYTGIYTLTGNRLLRVQDFYQGAGGRGFSFGAAVADMWLSGNYTYNFPDGAVWVDNTMTQFETNNDRPNFIVDDHFYDGTVLVNNNGVSSIGQTIAPADLVNTVPTFTPSAEPVWPNASFYGIQRFVFVGTLVTETVGGRSRVFEMIDPATNFVDTGPHSTFSRTQLELMLARYGYYTYTHPTHGASNYLLCPDVISMKLPDGTGEIPTRFLTVPIRLTGVTPSNYGVSKGAMPQRYVDAIVATTYVVYEDILGVGGLYEGL